MGLLGVTGCPDEAWESENLFQGLSCPLWVSPWAAWSRVGVLQITSPQLMGFGVRLGKKLTWKSMTLASIFPSLLGQPGVGCCQRQPDGPSQGWGELPMLRGSIRVLRMAWQGFGG